jgi:hypothetical protein
MRPSLRHTEIESQGGQRTPKQIDLHVWVIIVLIIALLVWVMM